jgi:hypothetical protein
MPDSSMVMTKAQIGPSKGKVVLMRRFTIAAIVSVAMAGFGAAGATAAPNPSVTGQPGAECGDPGATSEPAGFGTTGFANAEALYAGSDGTPSAANGSSQAVSQYDVACFQVTSNHPGG